MKRRVFHLVLLSGLLGMCLTCPAEDVSPRNKPKAAGQPAPATQPAEPLSPQAKVDRLCKYLHGEYRTIIEKDKDRVTRSLMVVSLSRVPGDETTATLFEIAAKENDAFVRAVAWECIFARAATLSDAQFRQFVAGTAGMLQAGTLKGDLRVHALAAMACAEPTPQAKAAFAQVFTKTNLLVPSDYPVIEALGDCLAEWKSRDVAEYLFAKFKTEDDFWRAECIIRIASANGAPDPRLNIYKDGSRVTKNRIVDDYARWWPEESRKWQELKGISPTRAQRLAAMSYVAAPEDPTRIDPDDRKWRTELELRAPHLRAFDVGLLVDATGSMGAALAWLRRDVKRLMNGFGVICLEPRIGLTFYRDFGDDFIAKTTPLTGDVALLTNALTQMTAKGGGDIPEAVLEGLQDCYARNQWSGNQNSRKAVILIGDAYPHENTQAECERLVRLAATRGFRLYAVKLMGPLGAPDLSAFDALSKAGGGCSLTASMFELNGLGQYPSPRGQRGIRPAMVQRPLGQANANAADGEVGANDPGSADPRYPARMGGQVGREVLAAVLTDAINPAFKERIHETAAVFWEMLLEDSPVEHRWEITPYRPVHTGTPARPVRPVDPQDQGRR